MSESTSPTEVNAKELIARVGDTPDDELTKLLEAEKDAEKPRSTVVEAIEAEQKRREEAAQAEAAAAEAQEPKYAIEDILANARTLTGFSRHLLAGALRDKTGKITVAEAKRLTKDFAEKKVEVGS